MKKIFLLLLLLAPAFAFSQKIVSKKGDQVKELKQECLKYTKVIIQFTGSKMNVFVGIDSGGLWELYDEKNQQKKTFETDIEVMNYMRASGWKYVEKTNNSITQDYLFEKVE